MLKALLIVDRIGYENNEKVFKHILSKYYDDYEIMYTRYEDAAIRKVRNWRIVGNAFAHIMRWKKSLKYVEAILKLHVDDVICLNPIVGIFLGACRKRRHFNHLIVAGFLFEKKKNPIYYNMRKAFTRNALLNIDMAVVYGSKEVLYYEKMFGLKNKFKFVRYGIDYFNQKMYTVQKLPEHYIFSGGGSNRDYETLIDAYHSIDGEKPPLVIATQPWRLDGLDTSDIIVLSNVVNETFGDVMKRSDLVTLSLKDIDLSAGHMVLLQAMSLGCNILVNDISSIRDYVDETSVEFYESRDVHELSSKLLSCAQSKDSSKSEKVKEIYERNYTSSALIERIVSACHELQ